MNERNVGLTMPFSMEVMSPLAEAAAGILTVMHIVGVIDATDAVSRAMQDSVEIGLHPQVKENAQKQALTALWDVGDKIEAARQAIRAQ